MNLFKRAQPRPILLCPGPVHIAPNVKKAVSRTIIGHREPEFTTLLNEMSEMIRPVVGLPQDDRQYDVAFMTGSGTAANETMLANLGALGNVLVVSNGEFGERLYEVVKLHFPESEHMQFGWQHQFNLADIEEALATHQYRLVAMVHHETSTGMLNPVAAVAKLAHKYGAFISVDAVSSIGAETIELKKWGVDALTGASGKALSAMPGVGILVVKASVVRQIKKLNRRIHYLDLYKHFAYMRDYGQTPNTPAVSVFVSLHAALRELHRQGLGSFQAAIAQRAYFTRQQLAAMGLQFSDYSKNTSKVITCVTLPPSLTFDRLAMQLKQRGIVIYNGKGPLKDKIFQIGHIGALRKQDTPYALKHIKRIYSSAISAEIQLAQQTAREEMRHAVR